MLKVSTGWADDPDTQLSADQALQMAVSKLDGRAAKAAMIYASVDMDLEIISRTLSSKLPNVPVIGCTTDGEIAGGEGFLEDSLVVTLFASDHLDFTVGMGNDAIADPDSATKTAVQNARSGSDLPPALCISLLEGLGTNIEKLVDGLRAELGPDVPVIGGAAGDQLRFQGTRQICNEHVTSDAVVVLMIHGEISVSAGVATGYNPLGLPHKVTKAEGPVVHEIDNRPAADLYADYLQQPSIFYPLAVQNETRKSLVLSSPLNFDTQTGALHLVNPVPQDSIVQLATASREEIVSAASNAVGQAFAGFDGEKVDAALLFSCAGRRATLGTRTVEEYETIKNIIGEGIPTAGFYCYGEIGPEVKNGPSLTHTNAFVAVLLGAPAA